MDNDSEPVNKEFITKKVIKLNHRVPKFEHLNQIPQKYDKFDQKPDQNIDTLNENFDKLYSYDKVGLSLDNVGRKLDQVEHETVGHIVGQTFAKELKLDRITFESEKLRSHSEASSRRNSNDGGRAKNEGFRNGKFYYTPKDGTSGLGVMR